MHEISEAAHIITKSSDPNAKVIFGAIIDEKLQDEIKITVVATGFAGADLDFKRTSERERERIVPVSSQISSNESAFAPARERHAIFKPQPRPAAKKVPEPEEDDELEIPAFIRKRMQEEG